MNLLKKIWLWDWARGRRGNTRQTLAIAGYIVVAIIVVAAIAGGGSSDGGSKSSASSDSPATTSTPSTTTAEPSKPKTPSKTPAQRLRDALDNASPLGAGEVKVKSIDYGRSLTITLKTPQGGFEGASTHDLDNSASASFKAVYGVAKYPATTETVLVFKGGLVSTTTGKDLPDVNTAIYTITGSQAKQINWSDDDAVDYNIDWSNYRDFVHPAIKGA